MRLISNRKGQVRVIEAFFAATLLLSCLALIPTQSNPKTESAVNLSWKAQNVLLTLDGEGQLAKLIDNHDWAALKSTVESSLPLTTWFNLTVLDQNRNILNPYPIGNGGPISANIVSYTYLSVSPNSTYTIYTLQLQLAVMG